MDDGEFVAREVARIVATLEPHQLRPADLYEMAAAMEAAVSVGIAPTLANRLAAALRATANGLDEPMLPTLQ